MMVAIAAHARDAWQVVSGDIYDVALYDADTYVAVGDYGRIMVGREGGRKWSFRDAPVRSRLSGIAFGDRRHGVAVGDSGAILRTTDAGDSWARVAATGTASLYDVTAISPSEYIAVGAGQILRSDDRGASWRSIPFPTGNSLLQVRFKSSSSGIAVGTNGTVLLTEDGGASWAPVPFPDKVTLFGCDFIDSLHGVVVGNSGLVSLTADGGRTWTSATNVPSDIDQLRQVQYLSPSILVAGGFARNSNKLIRSSDGGRTWETVFVPGLLTYGGFLDLASNRQGGVIAVGVNSLILRTSDGGSGWEFVSTMPTSSIGPSASVYFYQVAQADSMHLFATAKRGRFYASSDGGVTWRSRQVMQSTLYDLTGLIVRSKDSLITFGTNDSLYISSDGGTTWKSTTFSLAPYDPLFTPGRLDMVTTSVAFGRYATIFDTLVWRTTDMGMTWTGRTLDSTRPGVLPLAHSFPSEAVGYIVATEANANQELRVGSIYKSVDSGRSWTRLVTMPDNGLTSVDFRDRLLGVVCGDSGLILRTSDGGNNWSRVHDDTSMTLFDIRFVNDTLAYAVGDSATILETTDAGSTWNRVDVWKGSMDTSSIVFTNVFSSDGRHVSITGRNIFLIKDLGEFEPLSRVREPAAHPPVQISIQVVPNPAKRGVVEIKVAGAFRGATVEIVDVSGNVVARLSPRDAEADGASLFLWDSSGESAGCYLARCSSRDAVGTASIYVK